MHIHTAWASALLILSRKAMREPVMRGKQEFGFPRFSFVFQSGLMMWPTQGVRRWN